MKMNTAKLRNHEEEIDRAEVLFVDKPSGWTSFDVVNKIRHILRVRKAGHAGTLDPLATGLLIVCTGRMTKAIDRFADFEKEYDVEMRLGACTPSYDAATNILQTKNTSHVTESLLHATFRLFEGRQEQVPPMWSAAKIDGKRLYELARKGEEIARKARAVQIHSITPTRIALPDVSFSVVCSKGTYVRSLVNDIGKRLGCGAYVTGLRRTRIGEHNVRDAQSIEELVACRSERLIAPA